MWNIRNYIQSYLLSPIKEYPTKVQDTLIELITQKLEELYRYTLIFPEVISPDQNRLDILRAVASQFLFTIREDANIDEQVDILDRILYLYSKRGSIDTIENMWKYYGGNLPKDVKVEIPSYKLFKYSVSKLSGAHHLQDNNTYRSGVYEIVLYNNTYPIDDLKQFMIKELVAAGNEVKFSNVLHVEILSDGSLENNHYDYKVAEDKKVWIQLANLYDPEGLRWSDTSSLLSSNMSHSYNKYEDYMSYLSGKSPIFVEIVHLLELGDTPLSTYSMHDFSLTLLTTSGDIEYAEDEELVSSITSATYPRYLMRTNTLKHLNSLLYYTPPESQMTISTNLYDRISGEIIDSNAPGYFILGKSLLGRRVI